MSGDGPVVLGSGVTGLLVSASLSKAGIAHTLLGGPPPDDRPRLGESMNEGSSALMWRLFGFDATPHLYMKSHISLVHGELASLAYAANPRRTVPGVQRVARGLDLPFLNSYLVHVDRRGFDRALYAHALAQPGCRFLRRRVETVALNADRVTRLVLDDGSELHPSHVFDATGPRALLAGVADVPMEPLGPPQRVVWTHLRRTGEVPAALWWRHGTNLLRTGAERDGLTGISWMIPLGDTLSVGVSVDPQTHAGLDDDTVMQRLLAAWARRGFALDGFADHAPLQSLEHSYFARTRACGANWMLCGGGFLQVWFPTSSGLWGAMLAAALAPRFMAGDPEVPPFYERAMRSMVPFHHVMAEMVEGPDFDTRDQAFAFWNRWLAAIWDHFGIYLRTVRGELSADNWRYRALDRIAARARRTGHAPLLLDGLVSIRVEPDVQRMARGYLSPSRFLATSALERARHAVRSTVRPGPRPRPPP